MAALDWDKIDLIATVDEEQLWELLAAAAVQPSLAGTIAIEGPGSPQNGALLSIQCAPQIQTFARFPQQNYLRDLKPY